MNKKIIIGSCVILAVCIGFGVYILGNRSNDNISVNNSLNISSSSDSMLLTERIETAEYVCTPDELTERAVNLLKINTDTVGYIKISNTMVDYPIVQIPNNDEIGNSYYIDHDFYHEEAREGAVFLDYRNNFAKDESLHSDNMVIYGHNMANDSMFGSLSLFRRDYSFYEKNSIIELSSNYKDYKYKIFGFFIVSGSSTSDFKYWNCLDFPAKDDFDCYVNNVRSRSLVDIDVDVEYGDKLLALSTCYSDADDSRFVIAARRLRDGEVA